MDVERYKVDRIHAKSLENNPAGSPAVRDLSIYLPPDYYASADKRYPVIYQLHGYNGRANDLTITDSQRNRFGWLPPDILEQLDWARSCDYMKIDELITRGDLKPFILVQPDGSLYLPDKDGACDFKTGETKTKGSYYVNSQYTGNFEDYIVNDVISYVDAGYRTLADRKHRALMGTSMGGYGTLSIVCHHPQKFCAAAALSPANVTIDRLDWKLVVPIAEKALGRAAAEKVGSQVLGDLLDTQDLIFSGERRLLPTVVRGSDGKVISYDKKAAQAWDNFDINRVAEKHAANLKRVQLMINCEAIDEFGLAATTLKLHDTLTRLGIKHAFEIYSDPAAAALSSHIFGIAYKITPALKFCLGHTG